MHSSEVRTLPKPKPHPQEPHHVVSHAAPTTHRLMLRLMLTVTPPMRHAHRGASSAAVKSNATQRNLARIVEESHSRLCPNSSSMPKKRTSNFHTKPLSTVHPSLGSGAAGPSSSTHNDVQSVNDLIASARRTYITPSNYSHLPPTFSQTLPPQTRQLLSQPETPAPRPRHRQPVRLGRNGRPIAGPPPPRSWLLGASRYAEPQSELRKRQPERLYPTSIDHLPGLPETKGGRRLQDMCLRGMARNWEFVKEYERNNLAVIPTSHRMLLLSCIAVYGPEEGVGHDGLSSLAILPTNGGEDADDTHEEVEVGFNPGINNETFHRLDLSGSVGRSITFKQLIELVEIPSEPQEPEEQLTWEDTIARPISAVIPHLTHLSLSHPPQTVSWAKLLGLAKHVPALTHLSLAYWPVPTLTPNSQTVKVSSKYTRDIQYGATDMYSHTIDDNYQEAVDVLRRLARTLYSIEFLDLSGCTDWLRALTWHDGRERGPGLEWCNLWVKLSLLRLYSGVSLTSLSTNSEVAHFVKACKIQLEVQDTLNWWAHPFSVRRRKIYTRFEMDDPSLYDSFWFAKFDEESKKNHRDLVWFRERERIEAPGHIVMGATEDEVHTPVIWD